ncbi:hypothetical protein ZEAMMB73_Zm00001d048664 [Zea mays]|uniref:Uncharacterized protein n=1 Tax=Zea mays TaxID=4577 RepID=A0A1D6PNC5_MAIZE|nr:hypothetical protein ZEAMMB73_Zm00001d048664 [Zea mays]
MLTGGMSERLPDRGKKLLATLDAIHREQDHRQARGDGARAPLGSLTSGNWNAVIVQYSDGLGNEACER